MLTDIQKAKAKELADKAKEIKLSWLSFSETPEQKSLSEEISDFVFDEIDNEQVGILNVLGYSGYQILMELIPEEHK